MTFIISLICYRLGDSTAQSSSYAPPFMPGAQCVLGYATWVLTLSCPLPLCSANMFFLNQHRYSFLIEILSNFSIQKFGYFHFFQCLLFKILKAENSLILYLFNDIPKLVFKIRSFVENMKVMKQQIFLDPTNSSSGNLLGCFTTLLKLTKPVN